MNRFLLFKLNLNCNDSRNASSSKLVERIKDIPRYSVFFLEEPKYSRLFFSFYKLSLSFYPSSQKLTPHIRRSYADVWIISDSLDFPSIRICPHENCLTVLYEPDRSLDSIPILLVTFEQDDSLVREHVGTHGSTINPPG